MVPKPTEYLAKMFWGKCEDILQCLLSKSWQLAFTSHFCASEIHYPESGQLAL